MKGNLDWLVMAEKEDIRIGYEVEIMRQNTMQNLEMLEQIPLLGLM